MLSSKDANGCWLWQGVVDRKWGYGIISIKHKGHAAHRASWIAFNGPIPDGLFVCHHCDTPRCLNPDHLFVGTHADNMADMKAKGRGRGGRGRGGKWRRHEYWGEAHHSAKLSEAQVREIVSHCRAGASSSSVARLYGVTTPTVSNILRRKTWRQLPDELFK